MQLSLSGLFLSCYWQYYVITTVLASISVIIYTIAAYKYKFRQRNELSDVNERVIITEYIERQLDNEEMNTSVEEMGFSIVSYQEFPLLD